MPLDELQRIEIAIELDKGVSHQELARKFAISVSELKNIAKLVLEKDVSSKQKVHRKRKSESNRGLIIQKLLKGELPEKISEALALKPEILENVETAEKQREESEKKLKEFEKIILESKLEAKNYELDKLEDPTQK